MDPSDHAATNQPTKPAKDRHLETAGLSYVIADAALVASSLMEETPNWAGARAASGWAAGGLIAEHYGHPSANQQLRHFSLKLGDYLNEQGIDIAPGAEGADELRKKGVLAHAEDFLYRHPTQSLNAVYGALAADMVHRGLRPTTKMLEELSKQKIHLQYTIPGALVMAGALAALLLPEHPEKKNPGEARSGPIGHAIDWFEEKPLRISSAIYTGNNLIGVAEAIKRGRENPRNASYMAKLFAAATYMFANHELGKSSKNGSDVDVSNEAMQMLADRSAALVLSLPPAKREPLIDHVAGFLASQKGMTLSAVEIGGLIHRKLGERESSPPAVPNWAARVAAGKDNPASIA